MCPLTWQNVKTAPNRWAARWLRRRGWVCFYLDPASRTCQPGLCWLALYQEGEAGRTNQRHVDARRRR